MPASITPQDFVAKWREMALNERASSQSHFNDLCALLGEPSPTDADRSGTWYTFERGAGKASGGHGWADVWRKGCFGWEYKGPGRDLVKAYHQLLLYKDDLENPPLLIVSDMQVIQVHTNFVNTPSEVHTFTLDDLLDPRKLDRLRLAWTDPERFRPTVTTAGVTEEAAREFAKLADILRDQGEDPHRAAHYLIRLLFCLFAEDVGLLPSGVFAKLVQATKDRPDQFTLGVRSLFGAMATGGLFGVELIPHFNGRLFDSDDALPLSRHGLAILQRVAGLDWSSVEPAIFGTLFTRSLDPTMRAQLGAQYTSREDILLIVEPVLMAPLRRKWERVKADAGALAAKRQGLTTSQRAKIDGQLTQMLLAFMTELAAIRVLDPACGSGNFLYMALLLLLDLWKEVWLFMGELGLQRPMALEGISPSPLQLHGIEINDYAHELAQVTIWIGYIQWLRDNGFGRPKEPILKPIDSILQMDAILAFDANGNPVEPEWPEAEVIVGNPPFLGANKFRRELGSGYAEDLWAVYSERLAPFTDLVCYWLEKSRTQIACRRARRAGLIATNSVATVANQAVLRRINQSGAIFMAWRDRPWILEGAAVRVAIVAFDDGLETLRTLDGGVVSRINPDLTAGVDLTAALPLPENADLCFKGIVRSGPFAVDEQQARQMLRAQGNPNGRPNADVVRPYMNGSDITGRPRNAWIIDFGVDTPLDVAAMYEMPFEYVVKHVKPVRDLNNRPSRRDRYWLLGETCPSLRHATSNLQRFIATPQTSRHRVFVWLHHPVLPDQQIIVIAREDDLLFGVLQSRLHALWALAVGSRLGVGNDPRYTGSTTFETFPFPWPPGTEPTDDPRALAIVEAARELVEQRNRWLNPEGATEAELKKRTLTNLYNQRPTWLDLVHRKVDLAVLAAYGWPADLEDEGVLERLLALNLRRASEEPQHQG